MATKRSINPEMFVLARKIRGVSQKELAAIVGLSQGNISKIEMGLVRPDKKLVQKIATKLEFRIDFFELPWTIYPAEQNLYRKKRSLNKMDGERINGQVFFSI